MTNRHGVLLSSIHRSIYFQSLNLTMLNKRQDSGNQVQKCVKCEKTIVYISNTDFFSGVDFRDLALFHVLWFRFNDSNVLSSDGHVYHIWLWCFRRSLFSFPTKKIQQWKVIPNFTICTISWSIVLLRGSGNILLWYFIKRCGMLTCWERSIVCRDLYCDNRLVAHLFLRHPTQSNVYFVLGFNLSVCFFNSYQHRYL